VQFTNGFVPSLCSIGSSPSTQPLLPPLQTAAHHTALPALPIGPAQLWSTAGSHGSAQGHRAAISPVAI